MSTRILLVCIEGASLQKYLDESKGKDAQIDVATTINEFFNATIETSYNGLMIDMPTKIKNFRAERERVNNTLQLFPVIQLTCNEKTNQMKTFYSGLIKGSGSIEEFITQKCPLFTARRLRSSRRKSINFNVIISNTRHVYVSNSEKAATMNASQTGCFIYSIGKRDINSNVWFTIKELADQTPIHAQVIRQVDWGTHMSVPGIGLQFKDIKGCQLEDLQAKCMMV
ncbi:MAG: PilZ domain-containing protein [Candidatus Brocadiaceae bacterium]|nr:PilZ domain-containing protein [Candidatus Brocadiaceae bacterium]